MYAVFVGFGLDGNTNCLTVTGLVAVKTKPNRHWYLCSSISRGAPLCKVVNMTYPPHYCAIALDIVLCGCAIVATWVEGKIVS